MRTLPLLTLALLAGPALAQEVPLRWYKDAKFPNGLGLGRGYGVSFGDYDADGWPDIVVCDSGNVWHNDGGATWTKVLDLDTLLPFAGRRYGVSFGDYDNDGLPDIATEPRDTMGDSCFHLLRNLGGGPNFVDVATDPTIVIGQPCQAQAETYCWGDVDDDGDLDLFLPIYEIGSSPGNAFLENLGPTGPGGAYRLEDRTVQANLGIAALNKRPEGAQFVDVDHDGDIDLYSNGTLYANITQTTARFSKQTEGANGIGLRRALDEGAAFLDYDLDGDQDLFVSYVSQGLRIWENRGDGTFFNAGQKIEDPSSSGLGLSMADWDNDGDLDLTSQALFHRNQQIETGQRSLTTATENLPASFTSSMTPAWADFDRDGDLDCALGNFGQQTRLLENTLYDRSTPHEDRRYVRVRVVRDHPSVPRGLETEYGATVEVRLAGGDPGRRFRQFVASGHGYINQNEYALHFGMPPRGAEPLVFDVVVDFPGLPARGLLRIDPVMNPALGAIELETLVDREIVVFRSGKVILDGKVYPAATNDLDPRVTTTTWGLARTSNGNPLAGPVAAPGANQFVGLELVTDPDGGPLLVDELILDGQLVSARACGETRFNVAVWDVSRPFAPRRVHQADLDTPVRNDRSRFPFSLVLDPGRRYRVVAAVSELRATPIAGPVLHARTLVTGGLRYQDHDPCSGRGVVSTDADPANVYLALRYRERLAKTPGRSRNGGVEAEPRSPVNKNPDTSTSRRVR